MSSTGQHIDPQEPPERPQAAKVEGAPARVTAKILCRRVRDDGATMADIEEAIDRGHYSLTKLDAIAWYSLKFGGVPGMVVRNAAISVMSERIEDKTEGQINAERFRYWR